jgi:flagellar biosynthesis protein FlhB
VMAGQEQEQDRSEPASPFKLREARSRGQVAKSMELTSWCMLAAAVAMGWMMLDRLIAGKLRVSSALFDQAGHISMTVRNAHLLFSNLTWQLFSIFGLFAAALVGVALLAGFAQTGPVLSWHPIKPDFTRLNPAAGFKRVFNARMFYEAAKSILKLALLSAILYFSLRKLLPGLLSLQMMDVKAYPARVTSLLLELLITVLVMLAFIALVDFAFVKWDFAKRMRMSRRELHEEVKRRDGDPKIKARIRELQREAARRGASLKRVPEADVLITNPTHLCVAIKYERGKTLAPVVLAKGSGQMALRMRQKARQCRIPIIENRALARELFRNVPISGPVLPETYAAVARILMWVYRQRAGELKHA